MIAGLVLLGAGTYFYQAQILKDPFVWMVLIGLGAYVASIPMGSILFERIIASLRYRSNAGFLIYIADTAGYAGSILLLLYKEFFFHDTSVMAFFIAFSYATAGVGIISLLFCYRYFDLRMRASARRDEAALMAQAATQTATV
jgi:cation transport ATPase